MGYINLKCGMALGPDSVYRHLTLVCIPTSHLPTGKKRFEFHNSNLFTFTFLCFFLLNPNSYLSAFRSLTLDLLGNSVNSQFSLIREGDRPLGVSSLFLDIGDKGGVCWTS